MPEDWTIKNLGELPGSEYSPFHPELDEKYPVSKIIGPRIMDFVNSEDPNQTRRLSWVSIFRNSPARKSESEHIMGNFIEAAAKAGQWVDVPTKTDEPLSGPIESPAGGTVDFSNIILEYGEGTNRLIEEGLVEKNLDDDGREWLSPTDKFLNFVDKRFQEYGLNDSKE